MKWHPDKNNESDEHHKMAEKMFKDVNEAYSLLSDPKKRQMIDQGMNPDDPGFGGKIFFLFFVKKKFLIFFSIIFLLYTFI